MDNQALQAQDNQPFVAQTFMLITPSGGTGTSGADPGSDIWSAYNLGAVTDRPGLISQTVTNSDPVDTYSFTIDNNKNINLSLTGLSNDAELTLLDSSGNEIAQSLKYNNADESINVRGLAQGTYYAQVSSYNSANTNYTLDFSSNNPGGASDLLPTEDDIGILNGSQTVQGVGLGDYDTSDVLHFSVLGSNRDLTVDLFGLSNDADVRIISDSNSNHIYDSGDIILGGGYNGGSNPEHFNALLPTPGDYFAQVYQFSAGSTDYSLTLNVV